MVWFDHVNLISVDTNGWYLWIIHKQNSKSISSALSLGLKYQIIRHIKQAGLFVEHFLSFSRQFV